MSAPAMPHAPQAENAMLGGVLRDPRYLMDVMAHVKPDDCFTLRNRYTLEAMVNVHERGGLADVVTVSEELRAVGGMPPDEALLYCTQLLGATPDPTRTEDYARKVAQAAFRRRLLAAGDGIKAAAVDAKLKSDDAALMATVEEALDAAKGGLATDETQSLHDAMSAYMDAVEATRNLPEGMSGLATGYRDLDDLLDGFQPGSFNLFAARPGMGKSSLLLCIALRVAQRLYQQRAKDNRNHVQGGVYFWSGEMPVPQLSERLASIETGISGVRLRRGLRPNGISEQELAKFTKYAGFLARLPIYLDHTPDMTPAMLKTKALRIARRRGGLDLIIVDYIGLMEAGKRTENRQNEISYISRKLKQLAGQVAPVACASQLSREVEKRQDKRPQLSDLRDSGSLEQDADTVTFVYRDVVYNPNAEQPHRADLITAKNRHGDIGTSTLHFEKSLTKFTDAHLEHVDLRHL